MRQDEWDGVGQTINQMVFPMWSLFFSTDL